MSNIMRLDIALVREVLYGSAMLLVGLWMGLNLARLMAYQPTWQLAEPAWVGGVETIAWGCIVVACVPVGLLIVIDYYQRRNSEKVGETAA